MKKVHLRSSRLFFGAATLAVVMGLAPSSASMASAAISPVRPGTAAVTTHSVSKAAQMATLRYWTKQRRESAHWITTLNVTPAQVSRTTPAVPSGKAGRVSSGLPVKAKATPAKAAAVLAAGARHGYGQTGAMDYPFPFDSFNVPTSDYTVFPFTLNGALFFVNNGHDEACSGTSVASAAGGSNENEVWTAGHCVANSDQASPGIFDSFAEFIPAYNGTAANFDPFGIFVANGFSTATNWLWNGDLSVDEGAMTVGTNASGQTLGQAVGWDGFAWNFSPNESFTAFGYPVAAPFTGNFMVIDFASTAASLNVGGQGQPLIGIGNPMTGGASGGAWNIDWGLGGGGGYINGHNDYKLFAQPLAVYSPYQDSLSNTVRCFGASSC